MPIKKRVLAPRSSAVNTLRGWLRLATPLQREELARLANVSVSSLPTMGGGFRNISAETAIALEEASRRLHTKTNGRLPILHRINLSRACHGCDYARTCLPDGVVIASEFPIIDSKK